MIGLVCVVCDLPAAAGSFLCVAGDVAGLRSLAMTRPNLLCICIVINGSPPSGGFFGDGADLAGDLIGDDLVGELCIDDELERRRGVACFAVNICELVVAAELEVFAVGPEFVVVAPPAEDGGALTDPHELPRNSEPVLGSQSRGTLALGLESSAVDLAVAPKMSVDVVATDCAYLLLGDDDRLSADSMTRTNSRSSLADMVVTALCETATAGSARIGMPPLTHRVQMCNAGIRRESSFPGFTITNHC